MALDVSKARADFGDPIGEARTCRTACALFDFSFLEGAKLSGPRAKELVEAFTRRPLPAAAERKIFYALRVDASGNVVADLTVWMINPESFEVMSGRREDIDDLLACAGDGAEAADRGGGCRVFALQGPRALEALGGLGRLDAIKALPYFHFAPARLADIPCTVGRLGYTGEPGFEIIVDRGHAAELWNVLAARARPAGFIAADMLRIEAGFVLFANEFRLPVSPAEAGLGRFCRDPAEPAIKLVCFQADDTGISLPWRSRRDPQRPVAPGSIAVTSACRSIAAGILGLGYVPVATPVSANLRDPAGDFHNIRLVGLPFHDPTKKRPRAPWP